MRRKAHTIQCNDVQEMAGSYFQGELTQAVTEHIENHLNQCRQCRREFKILQELHRLDQARARGAVDPGMFPEVNATAFIAPEGEFITVKALIDKLVEQQSAFSDDETTSTQTMLTLIHQFLSSARQFLKNRPVIRAGKDWIKLEKKRARLLRKVLHHPVGKLLKPILMYQAEAYVSRGLIFQFQGDAQKAEENLSQSVVLLWALNAPDVTQTQRFLGELKYYEGDLQTAAELFADTLKNPETPPREQAILLRNLGNIAYVQQELPRCRRYLEQALSISRALREKEFPARDLMNLSAIDYHRGNLDQAITRTREAIDQLSASRDSHLLGQLHANLGTFVAASGDNNTARDCWNSALQHFNNGYFLEDSVQVIRNIALMDYTLAHRDRALELVTKAIVDYDRSDALSVQLILLKGRILRLENAVDQAVYWLNQARQQAVDLSEDLMLDAIDIEIMFCNATSENWTEVERGLGSTSAGKKRKLTHGVTVFDLENEAEIALLQVRLGQSSDSAKSVRRFSRMLKKYRKINGLSVPEFNSAGTQWSDIEQDLKEKIK